MEILDVVVPIFLVQYDIIKDSGIPWCSSSKNDMGKLFEFLSSIQSHLDVWKAVDDVYWYDVPIIGPYTLLATCNLHGMVIDIIPVCFDLSGRVNGPLSSIVSILLQN